MNGCAEQAHAFCKAPAFLPSTHCGVCGASADALLLWAQVMGYEPI